MEKKIIELKNISKNFEDQQVLKGIDLNIYENEFLTLLGPSGCGKTTLLRIIGGFEEPSNGQLIFDGKDISKVPPYKREVNTVFQKYALFPFLNVADNIAFGLNLKKMDKDVIEKKVSRMLELVGLKGFEKRDVTLLSGGQQQRVAIARALATEPKVLLCDEATSALDPNTTAGVLSLLKDINTRLGITIVVITHEMSVIQEICDRVAIIDGGLIAEEGGVEEIFRAPKTKIGQELVMHEGTNREAYTGKLPYSYRLVFKGGSENEPVLGQMMIELKNVVNILAANTRTIENQAFGQMLVQFPEEKEIRQKMIQYLTDRGVEVEEVEYV